MLEIVIVGRNDEGEFLCRAENEFGREETTAELIVEGMLISVSSLVRDISLPMVNFDWLIKSISFISLLNQERYLKD